MKAKYMNVFNIHVMLDIAVITKAYFTLLFLSLNNLPYADNYCRAEQISSFLIVGIACLL